MRGEGRGAQSPLRTLRGVRPVVAGVAARPRHRLMVHRIDGESLRRRVAGLARSLRRDMQDGRCKRETAIMAGAADV